MYRAFLVSALLLTTSTALSQQSQNQQSQNQQSQKAFDDLLSAYAQRAVTFTGKQCAAVSMFNVTNSNQKDYDKAIKAMLAFQKQNQVIVVKQKLAKTSLERQIAFKGDGKKAYTYHEIKNGRMIALSCYLK